MVGKLSRKETLLQRCGKYSPPGCNGRMIWKNFRVLSDSLCFSKQGFLCPCSVGAHPITPSTEKLDAVGAMMTFYVWACWQSPDEQPSVTRGRDPGRQPPAGPSDKQQPPLKRCLCHRSCPRLKYKSFQAAGTRLRLAVTYFARPILHLRPSQELQCECSRSMNT